MIIFIHGPDTFRSKEKLRELIVEFKKKRDAQGYNITRLDGAALTLERFRHQALSQGFLSPKRLVVVEALLERGKKDVQDGVADFLSSCGDLRGKEGNVVIFWEENIFAAVGGKGKARKPRGKGMKDAHAAPARVLRDILLAQEYIFSFPLLERAGLVRWIRARAKEGGAEIDPAAVDHLLEISGHDMWRLDRELSKLIALRKGANITAQDAAGSGEQTGDPIGFAFTDAVAARDVARSLQELAQLACAGVEPLIIHGMLVRLFRTVSLVKSYLEDDSVRDKERAAETLGLHPFVVKKTAPLAVRFNWDEIREVYLRLLVLDYKLKRQGDDPYLPIELFVVNLDCLKTEEGM